MIVQQKFLAPFRRNNDDSVEKKEGCKNNLKRNRKKRSLVAAPKRKKKHPWRPFRQKVGQDLNATYLKEVQHFLDRGKSQTSAENAAFKRVSMGLTVSPKFSR